MGQFFVEGGVTMFPTALSGLFFFAIATLHALRPDRRLAGVVVLLGVVTVGLGVLGLCVALVTTAHALVQVPAEDQLRFLAVGGAESLNNLILALLIAIPAALVGTVGAYRASRLPTHA